MVFVIQSLYVQHATLKEKDSSIADLQSNLEEVFAMKRKTDEELAKLRADMDQELARLRGELDEKIAESLKQSLKLEHKDSKL